MKLIRKTTSKPIEENPVILNEIGGNEILQLAKKTTVNGLLKKAEEMQNMCVDSIESVNFCDVSFDAEGYNMDCVSDNAWKAKFTKHSLSQFGLRYGIPSSYIQRCTNADLKGLVCRNFNEWIDLDKGKILVRRFNAENSSYLRGILITLYKEYDTPKIIKDVLNSPLNDWEVRQYLLSPERFHMRLVSGEKLNVDGEDLEVGLNVDSSDVGRNSLNLQLIIFRQICSNGLILPYSIGKYFRQVHIGEGAEELPKRIAAKLEEIPELKKIAERMICKTMDIRELPFDIESEEEIQKFRLYNGLTKDFLNKVIEMYETRQSNKPRWEFINCMTEVAQKYGIDSRLQFERVAGNLLVAA